jgi:hypothetical protein
MHKALDLIPGTGGKKKKMAVWTLLNLLFKAWMEGAWPSAPPHRKKEGGPDTDVY